ncbi:MAG TPA: EAL domain-containing protein [Bacillota bacterium]|nr:EAL domain-containing protein [Bacillota bacterium]
MNRNLMIDHFWKENGWVIAVSFVFLFIALSYRHSLYGIFGEENYLSIHLIMEFFLVTIAFTIAIQSWMTFPHILSNFRLWMGALFLSVGLLEIAHALTFKGMPFFFSESSTYKATWLFMVSRLTQVLMMFVIILFKDRVISPHRRWIAYSIAFLYALAWMVAIYSPTHWLPELVVDGKGTTLFKNDLQFGGIAIEMVIASLIIVRFRTKEAFHLMIVVASLYLMVADYFFTSYESVYDISNFMGHLFQLTGFYFLQRAVYHTSVEEPFQRQKEAEEQLKQNEKFLQEITSSMGEGLLVMNTSGDLTYMNSEAERLLLWPQAELLGYHVHDKIHRRKNGLSLPFEECTTRKSCENQQVYRVEEDWFIRKNGTVFPVSYVSTPFLQNGRVNGSIMVFRDITQQKKDQEMIQYMAFYDELTKLPNLRYFKERLNEMIDKSSLTQIAVFVLDIDRFKNMNEALGHSFGDLILKAVAARLASQLPPNILIGRLTGDEFSLCLSDQEGEEEIYNVCEQIQALFNEPLQVQHLLLNLTMSIGVAIYPAHGKNVDQLFQHANMALAEAQQKMNHYQLYQPTMDGRALDRLVLENDLRQALAQNELYVVYQPQLDTQSGSIMGVEALIRWYHPALGWISPAKFIPIAEETGLIIPIGEWVLRTACEQLKQWLDQGLPSMGVAVNLSTRQFYQQNLSEKVKEILDETGLEPWLLELEITESMMMNVDYAMIILNDLKQLGIQIAIDDFGTGYSSLNYLKHLPIDRLKIDQSFIRDLLNDEHDETIVSTIISMARNLKLDVIAEGVETKIQNEILQSLECFQIQGYLFSPPIGSEEFILQLDQLNQKAVEMIGSGDKKAKIM